jgi:glycosyltransferase involved in cell wall biosynthesis
MQAVYVSHNAVETALVQSQVLPYLRGLSARGVSVDLVTFESSGGAAKPDGVRWWPVQRQQGAHLFAKAADVLRGVITVTRLSRRAGLLHARSYVPGVIAAVAAKLTGRPFVFDMRGFLPDEYIDARYWTMGDLRYRVLVRAEGYLLARAAEVVVLTNAAARRLRTEPRFARRLGATRVTVIPCAVDLARFRPAAERDRVPTLLYTGSLGSFYALDEMLQVFRAARDLVPQLRFLIVNQSEHDLAREAIARAGLLDAAIELRGADYSEMPGIVGRAHVGIALVRQSPSKAGSSAIKVAEYLACGLPVIVNAGLGDADAQVSTAHAGHVMPGYLPSHIVAAGRALQALLTDEGARTRARSLAEHEYDLATGVERYADVYARVSAASTT